MVRASKWRRSPWKPPRAFNENLGFGTDFHGFLKLLPPSTGPLEGLECSKRAKNLINRKITIFYIEAIPQKKFWRWKKKFVDRANFFLQNPSKKNFGEKKSRRKKVGSKSKLSNLTKSRHFFSESDFFEKHFFESEKNIFFRSWKNFGGIASM